MGEEAQNAVSVALRAAVVTWVRIHPSEYRNVIAQKTRMDGAPERVFDKLYALSLSEHADKGALWPTLTSLLAISPDRLSILSAESYDAHPKKVRLVFSYTQGSWWAQCVPSRQISWPACLEPSRLPRLTYLNLLC